MIDPTHKQITCSALRGEVSSTALNMVLAGNKDSDAMGTARGAYGVQHYSYNGTESTRNDRMHSLKCKKFIYESLQYAAVCFSGKHEHDLNFNLGFYFLGRLTHCAQDYYAHSNGVAIGFTNPKVVLGGHAEGLTFCNPTSGKKLLEKGARNFLGHISLRTGRFKFRYSDDEIRRRCARRNIVIREFEFKNSLVDPYKKHLCYVLRLQEPEPLPHEYAHLDFGSPFCLASIALKNVVRRSYRDAAAYARILSKDLFDDLSRRIVSGPKNEARADKMRKEINDKLTREKLSNIQKGSSNTFDRLNLIEKIQTYRQHPKDRLSREYCAEIFDECLGVEEKAKGGVAIQRGGPPGGVKMPGM